MLTSRDFASPAIRALAATCGLASFGVPGVRALQPGDLVKIVEIHYDPPESPEPSFEFVEIANVGTSTVYLDGAVITDEGNGGGNEATFQFPGTPVTGTTLPLAPGAVLLLVGDAVGCPYAGIDWEFYGGGADSDDPLVPNLVRTSGLGTNLYLANAGDGVTLSVGITSGNIIPCSEIVDGASWETGGGTDVTATSRTICADSAPHPGIENAILSLQRCPETLDTDLSANDFVAAVRTPGIPGCAQSPPSVAAATLQPCVPVAQQPVLLTATASDPNGDLVSVRAYWRRTGFAAWDSVGMTQAGPDLYQAALPGFADQAVVEYFVRARDALGQIATLPPGAPATPARWRVGTTPIATIQSAAAADSCASSAYAGTPVHAIGVVTHRAREFDTNYFYVQNGVGAWAGIRVAIPDTVPAPDLGDSVRVSGTVREIYCATEIALDAGCMQVLGNGHAVRARVLASLAQLAQEANECMLVQIPEHLDVLGGFEPAGEPSPAGAGREFQVGDASGTAWVGDDTFDPDGIGYWYTPVERHTLESLTGIVAPRAPTAADPATRWRLEPRRDPDVDLLLTTDAPPDGDGFVLRAVGANPFRDRIDLEVAAPAAGRGVRLAVFDARGRRIRALLAHRAAGSLRTRVVWDGTDDNGHAVPAGVYVARLIGTGDHPPLAVKLLRVR